MSLLSARLLLSANHQSVVVDTIHEHLPLEVQHFCFLRTGTPENFIKLYNLVDVGVIFHFLQLLWLFDSWIFHFLIHFDFIS